MLQNIRQLAGEPPQPTGNREADAAAQEKWQRKLLAGLEYLFAQIENELEDLSGTRAAKAEQKMRAAKKRLERGRTNE